MNERARRLRQLDRVLIATLVPLFLIVFALQLREGIATGVTGFALRVSSARAGSFPVVEELGSVFAPRLEGRALEVGDQLLQLDDQSLLGASMIDFDIRAQLAARRPEGARIEIARGDARFSTTLFPSGDYLWWAAWPFALLSVATSLIILVRTPEWPAARSYFVSALCGGVFYTCGAWNYASVAFGARHLAFATFPIFIGASVWTYWNFTPSARPLRPWQRAQIWILGIGFFAAGAAWYWLPQPAATIGYRAQQLLLLIAMISMLMGLTRAYRRSDALERRQIHWVLYALYLALLPNFAWIGAALLGPLFGAPGLYETLAILAELATIALPLGILVSIVGYRFLDIDRVIGATASYTILGVVLLGVALQVIPRVAEAASPVLGVSPATGQWGLSLAFGVLAVQGHRWLRPWIDRRFFSSRVAVEVGLAALVAELGRCRTAQEMTILSAERIDTLLRPESVVVYAREDTAFTPVFARGRAVPPAFAADSVLVHALGARSTPLLAANAEIDPFDRAALATLGAEVITPLRRAGALVAFTCLGRKRTGDIYTPAELALLAAVASAGTEVLHRLGDGEMLEQAREMHASMRRYVPGAIAEQVESGRALEAVEREVTVLFVDLRGYTAYAEKRRAEEVFSTVNENTERVSRIVRTHGGTVVEFNGDGMMAVFGAPEALAGKERAAVEAARGIVEASPVDLPVGIGIATGPGFAGNIRSADRWIWSVVGDTTNLAARLQALTRDLDASIATDEPTRRAAGYVCADFARHADLPLRGRSQRVDVFALPLLRVGTV